MSKKVLFSLVFGAVLLGARTGGAVSMPMDQLLFGNPSIEGFFPVGTVEMTDVAADTVQFDVTPFAVVERYDNIGLGLDASVDESELVLTPLTPDQMTLNHGGWYGFPFKINFNDRPTAPVAFSLSAPGLDTTDFLTFPASTLFDTYFAFHFWFFTPSMDPSEDSPTEATVGHSSAPASVPEPASMLLLGTAILAGALTSRRKA